MVIKSTGGFLICLSNITIVMFSQDNKRDNSQNKNI